MELDLQSRMYTYEANKSEAIKFVSNISPHIKSYTRLMSQDSNHCDTVSDNNLHTPIKKEYKKDLEPILTEQFKFKDKKNSPICTCHAVAWTLMTSSCLSKGIHFLCSVIQIADDYSIN